MGLPAVVERGRLKRTSQTVMEGEGSVPYCMGSVCLHLRLRPLRPVVNVQMPFQGLVKE